MRPWSSWLGPWPSWPAHGFGGYGPSYTLLEFHRRTFDLILVGTIELPSL